jgi:hypothetical protein
MAGLRLIIVVVAAIALHVYSCYLIIALLVGRKEVCQCVFWTEESYVHG